MTKNNIIIFLFFSCAFTFSQNNVIVNYKVFPKFGTFENSEEIRTSKISNHFVGVDDELKKLNYELVINDSVSFFYLKSNMAVNEKAARVAKSVGGRSEYYKFNSNNKLIVVKDLMGQKFNVQVDSILKWKITNETKNIGSQKCFKATTIKKFRLKKRKNEIEVIAWFCPEIPLNFGPKEYSNLPGLILEIEEDKLIYLADKIDLKADNIINLKKLAGNTISESEFDKKIENTYIQNENILKNE